MDSLTQIVLGAAVGEAVAGKQLGNRALLWGAIAGTIPDLDVLANPFLDTVGELTFHRSLTHSLLFATVASPLLASLLYRWQGRASWWQWFWLFFLGFTTHALLDSFTSWGTQLFWPFSSYGVAFYNIFVIDPLYTLPFLILLAIAAFYPKESRQRRSLLWWSLCISTAYLGLSLVFQQVADGVFRKNLQAQGVEVEGMITKATPFNILFWSGTAQAESGFYNGFYSILDRDKKVDFTYLPQQKELLQPYLESNELQKLLYVTKGYYTVEKDTAGSAALLVNDQRFGQFNGWQDGRGQFVFVYTLTPTEEELKIGQREFNWRPDKEYLMAYVSRIFGE
ncbi:metal-dependent hydrolase [Cesiribacter sp. SM1]|uniref:metal-dependent hydrolase n=1 Tax=Cesiribacter sp. SM1 TaxID=2861196 RepID=UPI001CD5939B|nr:metal-dependent hydrolase [Cesiribacter sp. SM1]